MKLSLGSVDAADLAARMDRFARDFLSGLLGESADEHAQTMADGGHEPAAREGDSGALQLDALVGELLTTSMTSLSAAFEDYVVLFAEDGAPHDHGDHRDHSDGGHVKIVDEAFLLRHAAPLMGTLVGAITETMADHIDPHSLGTPPSDAEQPARQTAPVQIIWRLDGISQVFETLACISHETSAHSPPTSSPPTESDDEHR